MANNNDSNPSFFDPKTILAIVAVAGIYFGWQTYLGKKYPGYGQKIAVNSETVKVESQQQINSQTPSVESEKSSELKNQVLNSEVAEKLYNFSNDKISFSLTNRGMGLKNVELNNYVDKNNEKIKLSSSEIHSLFEMNLADSEKPLNFEVKEVEPGHYIGSAQLAGMTIVRDLKYNSENNSFVNKINFTNVSEEILKGFSLIIPDKIQTAAESSIFFPSYEHQDFVLTNNGGSHSSLNFSSSKDNLDKDYPVTSLISSGSQYFATAILDKSEIFPNLKIMSNFEAKTAKAILTYKPPQLKNEFEFNQILYAGPKSIDTLKAIDAELIHVIDFGFFGMISRPLVFVMKAFYSLVGNWGVAIILLTLLVRLCVLPFNIMSIKSMKAMQKIQPKMQALREKYKDDPMTMNKETMALMKQSGANPLGGCLPMLVQIPIFFALYRVIGSSIELYHAPFFAWITDLSSHDKFYVLPILMGATMFFQQKITPTTMDPTQAKIMLFLPLVFSFFMLQLPSGLTLYMFVSGLFGIIQQLIIMRDSNSEIKN